MTEFKYLNTDISLNVSDDHYTAYLPELLLEMCYQLKRIADKLDSDDLKVEVKQ